MTTPTLKIKELKEYTKEYIEEKLDQKIIIQLKQKDYVTYKYGKYTLKYVGLILAGNTAIKCYPKYLPEEDDYFKEKYKQIIQVIRKYNKTEEINYDNDESGETTTNLLSLMIFFIEDYYENGIYTNNKLSYQINGNGEINWDKTINYYNPVIIKHKPYYMEYETRYNQDDIYNIFRQLHKSIITQCSKKLENAGILELFDLTPVKISDRKLNDFPTKIMLKKIEQELNIEYNTHKQKLLRYMHSFLKEENIFENDENISTYGTSSYHTIWEKVCKDVLGDQLNKKLEKIEEENLLPNGLNTFEKDKKKKLIELIDKPEWIFNYHEPIETNDEEEYENAIKKNTLIPDIILFHKKNFIILDAKYYAYELKDNKLTKQPGIESITKQYLYELAYKDFIKKTGFTNSKNALLFPSNKEKVENVGKVKLDFLSKLVKKNNETFTDQEDIQLIMLPAEEMYEKYLNKDKKDISKLKINGLFD